MKKINSHLLKASIVMVGMIIFALCLLVLPPLAQRSAHFFPEVAYLQYPVLLGMYATAIPFFYALYHTIKIIQSVDNNQVYSNAVANSLNRIKQCALTIITLYVVGIFILGFANAQAPIIMLLGFSILVITFIIASGAAFLHEALNRQLKKQQTNGIA